MCTQEASFTIKRFLIVFCEKFQIPFPCCKKIARTARGPNVPGVVFYILERSHYLNNRSLKRSQ